MFCWILPECEVYLVSFCAKFWVSSAQPSIGLSSLYSASSSSAPSGKIRAPSLLVHQSSRQSPCQRYPFCVAGQLAPHCAEDYIIGNNSRMREVTLQSLYFFCRDSPVDRARLAFEKPTFACCGLLVEVSGDKNGIKGSDCSLQLCISHTTLAKTSAQTRQVSNNQFSFAVHENVLLGCCIKLYGVTVSLYMYVQLLSKSSPWPWPSLILY